MGTGIAHVSFRGGGIFLPARSPYDRQTLIEYVTDLVGAKRDVQVLLQDRRWIVHPHRGQPPAYCAGCGTSTHCTCQPAADLEATYCVNCAFGSDTVPIALDHSQFRQAV